jgi:branched-subunit amino acid transport protein
MINYKKAVKITAFIIGIAAIILFLTTNNLKVAILAGIISVNFIHKQIIKLHHVN